MCMEFNRTHRNPLGGRKKINSFVFRRMIANRSPFPKELFRDIVEVGNQFKKTMCFALAGLA